MGILAWIAFGFVIGLFARTLVPGRQTMGLLATTLLGIAGSILGGLAATAVGGGSPVRVQPAGFLGSLIGAILLLAIGGAVSGRRTRTA